MAGTAHLHGHTRWPDKPTSGRYVYKSDGGGWHWQCDLHGEPESMPDQYGLNAPTMQDAFAGALAHAASCTATTEGEYP